MEATLSQFQTALAETTSRITDLEGINAEHETRISDLKGSLQEILTSNKALCVLNWMISRDVLDNMEPGHPTEFVEKLIPNFLDIESFPGGIKVDRAHCTSPPPSKGGRPRIMIARMHHYPVKEMILWLARQHTSLKYKEAHVSIFPDFTAEVLSQRKAFDEVKNKLKEAGIHFGLLFPARLIVTQGNKKKIFGSVAEAEDFVNSIAEQVPSFSAVQD